MGKKICIVFEETTPQPDGIGFNVYMDGVTDKRRKEIDQMDRETQLKELSTAEFWALRCFQITMAAMGESGAIRLVQER